MHPCALVRQGAIFLDHSVRSLKPVINAISSSTHEYGDNVTCSSQSMVDLTKGYLELERAKRMKRERNAQDETSGVKWTKFA